MNTLRDHFHAVADTLEGLVAGDETVLLWFAGERSAFARLNDACVRQAGVVVQRHVSLQLGDGQRHARASLDLGASDDDAARLAATVAALRSLVAGSAPDPYLLIGNDGSCSDDERRGELPDDAAVLGEITRLTGDLDLVGVWAAGEQARGFANTRGVRRWHSRDSFNLDWSVHLGADLAVKNSLAGERWQPELLQRRLDGDRERLALLALPARTLAPGRYRAFLAPAALAELLQLLSWGGFGLRSQRTGQSALAALARGERRLAGAVRLSERLADGLAPAFTPDGFHLPDEVVLVDGGCHASALASPRSAREYDVPVNCASESPQALDMAAGDLDTHDVPALVGDGIEVANLWYCNHVDRNEARVTGMTRFACFVIEDGRRVAPLTAMRFDDSLYGLLGGRLLGLGRERELLADNDTYGQRSLAAMRLPGALAEGLRLVD